MVRTWYSRHWNQAGGKGGGVRICTSLASVIPIREGEATDLASPRIVVVFLRDGAQAW